MAQTNNDSNKLKITPQEMLNGFYLKINTKSWFMAKIVRLE